jgi:hypothetical protein
VHEESLVALGVEPVTAQQADLVSRPAEVETGDDLQNADAAQTERSARGGAKAAVSSKAMTAAPSAR